MSADVGDLLLYVPAVHPQEFDGAISYLEGINEADMEGFVGQDMRFEIGEKKLPFTAEDFQEALDGLLN